MGVIITVLSLHSTTEKNPTSRIQQLRHCSSERAVEDASPYNSECVQILSDGRTLFAPTVVRASLLCRKIATLGSDFYFVFVLYFGQLCSFLTLYSSLIPLFQIFYFFKMNIFSAARNNSNSRKRHILNRKDLCFAKFLRYAFLPQPLRYHARRLDKI